MTLLQNFVSSLEDPRILFPVLLWSVVWKGIALWRCGRNNQLPWFVVLLVLNTLGIGEIIYLSWFQKDLNKKRR